MKVICHMFETCIYRDECDHAKPHDIINRPSLMCANNCILEHSTKAMVHGQIIECKCGHQYLALHQRKDKLQKLNEFMLNFH